MSQKISLEKKKKIQLALSPKLFAFGGSTKPVSQLLFQKYDADHNGLLSMDELRFLCYDMGYYLSDEQFQWAKIYLDKDGNGTISYDEFGKWWQNPLRFDHLLLTDEQLEKFHQMIQLFRSFDRTNQGNLSRTEFSRLFEELIRRNLIEENQAKQFDEIDRSNDGSINFNEVVSWFFDQGVLVKLGILPSDHQT